jgi:hypothetical protein
VRIVVSYEKVLEELRRYSGGVEISVLPIIFERIGLEPEKYFKMTARLLRDSKRVEVSTTGTAAGEELVSSQIVLGYRESSFGRSTCRHSDQYIEVPMRRRRR